MISRIHKHISYCSRRETLFLLIYIRTFADNALYFTLYRTNTQHNCLSIANANIISIEFCCNETCNISEVHLFQS